MNGKVTYRQQFTRCGKQRCRKCKEGSGHGPYWYAYWSENGRTVSKYIGAVLPEQLQKEKASSDSASNAIATLPQIQVPALRVYLLGQFRIERKLAHNDWQTVDGRLWHRRRARSLLGCLLSSPNRRLGREQVMNLLWPDLDIDIAANRLNGAVHELRQMLDPELARPASSRLLRLERDILELANADYIWVDAEAFEHLIKEADTITDSTQSRQLQEKAASLYRGSYLLEELYSEWAAQRRDALHRAWVGLLLNLAQSQAYHEEYASAIDTLDRLRTADPTNETAVQHLMMLLTQRDRRGEALQVYRQHQTMLERDYESEPLPETSELYEKLRKGHVPTLYSIQNDNQIEAPTAPVADHSQKSEPFFARPVLQLGRQKQSPLIGRERELQTLTQVMYSLEEMPGSPETMTHRQKSPEDTLHQHQRFKTASISRSRDPHFVLLRGEPGIGKTRLAEELSLEAYKRGWTVAWSRSYEQESSIPYHPWTDLLRTLFKSISDFTRLINQQSATPGETTNFEFASSSLRLDRLRALLPDLEIINQAATPTKATPAISLEQERLYLWEAALGLIGMFSKQQPLLLVLDDLHWADDSSIDLLTYLIHHIQDQCILLIGTCREGELAPQHKLRSLIADLQREQAIVTVPILPLTQTQIGTLVSYLPQNIVQSIQSQAAGNPFFAEELARYVGAPFDENIDAFTSTDQKSPANAAYGNATHTHPPQTDQLIPSQADHEHTRATVSLPEAIAAVLERRLDRLSQGCQQLLGKAAVIGGSFELRQLLPMANEYDEDNVLDLLEEALNAGLLIEEGTGANILYHFWHPLIINHLYRRLSAARRAQLHRRAAEAFKTIYAHQPEKIAATIVYHLSKGGGARDTLAYYAELSSNQAYALAAYAEAQQYCILVFQAFSENNPAASHADVHQDIQQILSRGIDQLPFTNPLHLCHILERLAECSTIQGNFAEGRQVYEYILAIRTSNRFQQYMHASTLKEDMEERQKKEAQIQALLWREIGNSWTYTSEYESANLCYQRGKEVMSQANVTNGAAWACLHLQYGALLRLEGDYYQARRYLQEALTMLEEIIGYPKISYQEAASMHSQQESQGINQTSHSAENVKNLPPSRIERALIGDPLEIGYAHERLGIVAASIGEVNSALDHLHTALTIYEQSELISKMARVCGNLGAAYIIKGAHDSARMYMQRSLELAERGGDLPNMTFVSFNLGDMAQRSGELQEAETWFTQCLSLAERINDRERISTSNIALASVQGDQGKLQEAAISIQRAISISRAIKNQRCIRYSLTGLADLRICQATALQTRPDATLHHRRRVHLLTRAKTMLQRTISLKGMEIEHIVDGKHLLALIHFLLGDFATALEIAQQTLKDAQGFETPRIIERIYRLLGRIHAAQKQLIQATHYFQEAMRICSENDLRLDYARTLHCYASLLLSQDKQQQETISAKDALYQQGLAYLQEASQIFQACNATIDLAATEQLRSQHNTVSSTL